MTTTGFPGLAFATTILCIGLAACADAPLAPAAAPAMPAADAGMSASGAEVIQSVTGNGHAEFARTYTFNIFKLADGTVTGWYHVRNRGAGGAHERRG